MTLTSRQGGLNEAGVELDLLLPSCGATRVEPRTDTLHPTLPQGPRAEWGDTVAATVLVLYEEVL